MQRVSVGDRTLDPITGFEGVVISRTEYLHGCVRVSVEGPDLDGKPQERWYDEPRLEITEAGAFKPVLSIVDQTTRERELLPTGGPDRPRDPGR